MKVFRRVAGFLLLVVPLAAQTPRRDSVVVTGTYEPLPLEEADRAVRSIDVRQLGLVSNTFTDLLRLDSSVDLRQRGVNGMQADISIRGGTFGQTLILLDGLRLNDVQSGHHNLNLPAPLEAIGKVEVLKGSGSTLYGSDAVGGVVNFITRTPETSEVRLRGAVGNFGVNQQRGTATWVGAKASQQLAFSRDFSTGFIPNRDYRNLNLSSTTRIESDLGDTHLHLSHRDSPFGAEQFYGNYNSWERTRGWWGAIRQQIGSRTTAALSYRRHTDLFVLYRDRPELFTNRHATENYQVLVRRHEELGRTGKLHYGAELLRDDIASNNLGRHQRTRGSGYIAWDVRAAGRFSFSAGLRDEIWGSGNHELSPTFSTGVWLTPAWKARAGVGRAFRLPTYTDLYYQDPANLGNPALRPEKAWNYEGGVDWNRGGRVRASATVFHRRETDGIDYVRTSPTDIWRATNFQSLQFTGVEAGFVTRLQGVSELELQYTGLRGAQSSLAGVLSKYVFNYPVHNGVVSYQRTVAGLALRSRIGVTRRFERDSYALWDGYAAYTRGRVRPFFQLTNVTDTVFEEIPGVAMPGRAVVAGIELIAFIGR